MDSDSLFIVLGSFAIMVSLGLMLFMHETTHQTIFRYAGVESEITYDLMGGHTTAKFDENYVLPEWASIAQANTEAFGYQLQASTIGLMLVMFVCSLYIGQKVGVR